MTTVELEIAGYNWKCPECNTWNHERDFPRGTVCCSNLQCKTDFEIEQKEEPRWDIQMGM